MKTEKQPAPRSYRIIKKIYKYKVLILLFCSLGKTLRKIGAIFQFLKHATVGRDLCWSHGVDCLSEGGEEVDEDAGEADGEGEGEGGC